MEDFLCRVSCDDDDEYFLDRLQRIFGGYPCLGVPPEATQIVRGVFLGTIADAENTDNLHRMGYIQLNAEDNDTYSMAAHFNRCVRYIKTVRHQGGAVLICGSGVSRSGAICMAYLMGGKNKYLLEAARELKDARRTALCNVSFMQQLVQYAKDQGLLDICPNRVKARRFGGDYDRYRVHSASLPDVEIREPFSRLQYSVNIGF